MKLSERQLDRARGSVVASAVGDALGSQYEFGPPIAANIPIVFGIGFFGTGVGEWTDDTSMAIPILQSLALGKSLNSSETLGNIAQIWKKWAKTAPDVGNQTKIVLHYFPESGTEEEARKASLENHNFRGVSAGNGSLMRTGPVSLGYLYAGSEEELIDAASRISQLTHWEQDNIDAVVLWNLAIRAAILTGKFNMLDYIGFLPEDRRKRWEQLIIEALESPPNNFGKNGWVVSTFQAALCSVVSSSSIREILENGIRVGGDTDTVAAIAGSLAGAVYGFENIPEEFTKKIYGWPGLSCSGLVELVDEAVRPRVMRSP